jgi:hypothetical protein
MLYQVVLLAVRQCGAALAFATTVLRKDPQVPGFPGGIGKMTV